MELPKRKRTRLPDYDYRQAGYYFVTICTHNRACLFGTIENTVFYPSALGRIAAEELGTVPSHRPNVELVKSIIMPNHIHAIVRILEGEGRDTTCRVRPRFSVPMAGSLPVIVGAYKAAVTRRIKRTADMTSHVPTPIWQKRYYEHIIPSQRAYDQILRYIDENPLKWDLDPYHCE